MENPGSSRILYWAIHIFVLLLIVWARFDSTAVSIGIIVIIFSNLGEKAGPYSAYSIFNKGCQYLLGDARQYQVEEQLRGGNLAPRAIDTNEQKENAHTNFPSKFINRPCPCGSGVKAKRCCASTRPKRAGIKPKSENSEDYDFTGFDIVR